MPPIGKRSDVTTRALVRLGAIDSKSFAPTLDAKVDALEMAIAWYSGLRPRIALYEVNGDDTKRRFVLSTDVTGWVKGSDVGPVQIVTSADTNDESVLDLELDEWQQRVASDGKDVLMLTRVVGTGPKLRVTWSAPHVVHETDAALTTIPERDADAFVSMFSAFMARWISRKASDISAASLGADQIDAEPIGERWKRRATELEKNAMDRIAPRADSVVSAGASIEWRDESELSRQPRIGH